MSAKDTSNFKHLHNRFPLGNVPSQNKVYIKCQNIWRTVNPVKCSRPPSPPSSVSTDSYISNAWSDVASFCRFLFSFAKAGQPQLTNQNAGSAQREAGNLRKQTSAVNQKWFQRMITDGATEECSYKFCVSPVIHTFPKLLSTLLQNSP